MTISANYPAINPSLLLDFTNSKALDPRITFTRATTATYYDAKSSAKAEENLLLQSQTFDNASWTKNNTTITANTTTAPDGTATADAIVETATASTFHNITQSASTVVGQVFTFSFYAKESTRRYAWFGVFLNPFTIFRDSIIDLQTGLETGTTAGTLTYTFSSTSVGNGWYRYVIVTQAAVNTGTITASFGPAESSSSYASYTGAVDKNIYAWGAQLEQRSAVTAYTATTTAPITNYIPTLLTAVANDARFDHNPTTRESLGLLIEEQRTNLITYSEQFDDGSWIKLNSTVSANVVVAPDGTLTGDKIIDNSTSGTHVVYKPTTFTATAYTISIYAKAGEKSSLNIFNNIGGGFDATFNLSNGTVTSVGGSGSATITSVGNGWYRCTTTTNVVASGPANTQIRIVSAGNVSYVGNGYDGLYIWGIQVEAGAFATSYIPTVASQVTRSADSASMTGTNFSSWYNNAEGTVYSELSASIPSSGSSVQYSINDDTVNNYIQSYILNYTARPYAKVIKGTAQAEFTPFITLTSGVAFKTALAYKTNDIMFTGNGTNGAGDSSALIPTVNQISFGNQLNSSYINGCIKKIAYYPIRITNAQLQALTG